MSSARLVRWGATLLLLARRLPLADARAAELAALAGSFVHEGMGVSEALDCAYWQVYRPAPIAGPPPRRLVRLPVEGPLREGPPDP